MKSAGFHGWNLLDFMKSTRFHPWNLPDSMKSTGFHPWNLPDSTMKSAGFHPWNLPDFMKSARFHHEIHQISSMKSAGFHHRFHAKWAKDQWSYFYATDYMTFWYKPVVPWSTILLWFSLRLLQVFHQLLQALEDDRPTKVDALTALQSGKWQDARLNTIANLEWLQ